MAKARKPAARQRKQVGDEETSREEADGQGEAEADEKGHAEGGTGTPGHAAPTDRGQDCGPPR